MSRSSAPATPFGGFGLRGVDVKEIYEMHGRGRSARTIARELGLARNTVLRYLNSPDAILPKPRSPRGSKLDSYTEYIDRRLAEGLENCVVLLRELRARGYQGSYTMRSSTLCPACSNLTHSSLSNSFSRNLTKVSYMSVGLGLSCEIIFARTSPGVTKAA